LRVVHADTALLQFHELRERKVELVIGRLPRPFLEEDLKAETLFDEPFVAYASSQSRWARRGRIDLAELLDEPWVLPPYDSVPGALIADIFRAHKLEPPRASTITLSVHLTAALVASGRFVGLLPQSVLHFSAQRLPLKALPVELADQRIVSAIITVRKRTMSPLADRFIKVAHEMASSISEPRTPSRAHRKRS
jgi:DNA-binding transcriptional LysR family regulator